ncbi:hypothetical protein GCM10011404_15770 [Sphingomonas prati]|uniref:O-antigen ligase domain-containing protein n=1 Tax=Sphingomonas prati TaxID=1843237 RepID=A0A7W9BSL7_9SPHN|nr:hypothetical protein [Sphingomonas prati]MBB5729251.1 hypothetical protein [Sphingomonas prati]GGE83957.1 hypothetical protein GCM10011404_15770 [Sphingomonas prati]
MRASFQPGDPLAQPGVSILAATHDVAPTIPADDAAYARPRRAPWAGDAILVALFAFIQLGYSYWLSVAGLTTVLVMIRLRRQLFAGLRTRFWALLLPLPMLLSVLSETGTDQTQDLLRVLREALMAILMILVLAGATLRPIRINRKRFVQVMTVLAGGLFLLTILQVYALRSRSYLGFPREMFAFGQGTIPGELDLYYSNIRAAGTFSEPSYFAFILLSIMMIAAARFDYDRKGVLLAAMVLVTGILSQAASFVLFAALIGVVFLVRTLRGGARVAALVIIPVAATFLLILGSGSGTLGRVQAGTSATGDSSIFARIVGPLLILPDYLMEHPFGAPISTLPDVLQPYAAPTGVEPEQYLMNGMFNLFFEYGFFGLVLLIVLLWRRDVVINLYIACCMLFNGAFLAIDKLAVICLVVAASVAIRKPDVRMLRDRRAEPGVASEPPPTVGGGTGRLAGGARPVQIGR